MDYPFQVLILIVVSGMEPWWQYIVMWHFWSLYFFEVCKFVLHFFNSLELLLCRDTFLIFCFLYQAWTLGAYKPLSALPKWGVGFSAKWLFNHLKNKNNTFVLDWTSVEHRIQNSFGVCFSCNGSKSLPNALSTDLLPMVLCGLSISLVQFTNHFWPKITYTKIVDENWYEPNF